MAARRDWAEEDSEDDEEVASPRRGGDVAQFRTEVDEHGIATTMRYEQQDGKTIKVMTKVKVTEIKRWTNEHIKARKSMVKFGKAGAADPVMEKRLIVRSEEVVALEFSRKTVTISAKDEAEDKFHEESLVIAETMNAQKKAWTEINKLKQEERDGLKPADAVAAPTPAEALKPGVPTSGYVPPALREGAAAAGADGKGKGKMTLDQQQQESSLRITNLSDDVRQGDLEDLFGQVGRLARVYLARDQSTGMSRGFAFVTYHTREDAQKAINKLNGHGYDNLILQVMFAKPRV